jgi:hypothetical protein
VEPTPPGHTDLVIEDHLSPPFELRRVRLSLDGQVVYGRIFEGDAPQRILAQRAPLPPGEHHAEIEVDVIATCNVAGALRAAYTVHAARALDVAAGQAGSLTWDIHARSTVRDFGERLELTTSADGALHWRRDEAVPHRYRNPERCPEMTPTARAFCRAEADVAEARQERDVVRLLCANEKLREMRALPPDDPKIVELGMQADDCVGQAIMRVANYVEARSTCPDAP